MAYSANGKKLIIVESPSKCKTFSKILGKSYLCIASKGHLTEIDTKAFDINQWNSKPLKFKIISRQYKTVQQLKKYIATANEVILATDCDREGESIAWHICDLFHLSFERTKRLIFQEITPFAISSAIRNPSIINMNTVHAQMARQLSDLVIGYTISPMLWKYIGVYSKQSLSAGRCQTPTLKLIYDHYIEERKYYDDPENMKITHSVSSDFSLFSILDSSEERKSLISTKKSGNKISANLNHIFSNESDLILFLKSSYTFQHQIIDVNRYQKETTPPIPLITTSLQQLAAQYLQFSPKQTMKYAQTLYEKGHITYMRTDNPVYSDTFMSTINSFIQKQYGSEYVRGMYYSGGGTNSKSCKSSKKVKSQDAHEAVRPTQIHVTSVMESNEKRLYQFIRNHTLQSCMKNAIYDCIEVNISAPPIKQSSTQSKNHYISYAKRIFYPGYKIVSKNLINNSDEKPNNFDEEINKSQKTDYVGYDYINDCTKSLDLSNPTNIDWCSLNTTPNIKEFKVRYSEASIIKTLEKKGIGRPSTYTNLIETVQNRQYVKKQNIEGENKLVSYFSLFKSNPEIQTKRENLIIASQKNKLSVTNLGVVVSHFIYQSDFSNLFDYDYTKQMEQELDDIATGKLSKQLYIQKLHEVITKSLLLNQKTKLRKFEIEIDENHVYLFSRYGESIKNKKTKQTSGIQDKDIKKIDILGLLGLVEKKKENTSNIKIIKQFDVAEIIDESKKSSGRYIGIGKNLVKSGDCHITLKCGPYGHFLELTEIQKQTKQTNNKQNKQNQKFSIHFH